MNSYEQRMRRLREALGVSSNTQAFKALGLTRSELMERNRSRIVPGAAIYKLTCAHPENSGLSSYVIHGGRRTAPKVRWDFREQTTLPPAKTSGLNFPAYEEMAAFMDAEMGRMGIVPGAAA